MEENKTTAITKEKTDVLKEAYKDTLEILDAYDHQTLIRPEGAYYDENETIEEVAVNMLYDMIKNPVWYECDKLCGKTEIMTSEEAFNDGWDYPPRII